MIATLLEDILKSEAEFGLFYCRAKIGKNKAIELRKQGFQVTDMKVSMSYPRLHYISWKNSKVSINLRNVNNLTFAQQLWIISMKNQPKN